MIIDMQAISIDGVMPGPPDYPFAALPKPPSQIGENVQVTGVDPDAGVEIFGSIDD